MTDYFKLLGLSLSFNLDQDALEKAYFQAQRTYHPDRFVGKPEAERLQAMQRSVDANQAYNTLKNPLKRAQHLLHLQNIQVETEADSVKPSQALLVEVMELRESPPDGKILARMVQESIDRIGKHYETQDRQAMAQETLRLGYLMKI